MRFSPSSWTAGTGTHPVGPKTGATRCFVSGSTSSTTRCWLIFVTRHSLLNPIEIARINDARPFANLRHDLLLAKDRTRAAEKYEVLRRKLVKLFEYQKLIHIEE